jgi:hypothetical protein
MQAAKKPEAGRHKAANTYSGMVGLVQTCPCTNMGVSLTVVSLGDRGLNFF